VKVEFSPRKEEATACSFDLFDCFMFCVINTRKIHEMEASSLYKRVSFISEARWLPLLSWVESS
jgi:hypothetical protein